MQSQNNITILLFLILGVWSSTLHDQHSLDPRSDVIKVALNQTSKEIFEVSKPLENAGQNCWWKCGKKSGKCSWCGSGKCCRKNWNDGENGCSASEGGINFHACIAETASLKNAGQNCWWKCGKKSGKCSWCGSGKMQDRIVGGNVVKNLVNVLG